MRKHQLAAALFALAGASIVPVHAQTSVEIYGLIDTSVERLSNVDAAGNSQVRMPTFAGGIGPSRIGFRGEENLGNGLKAIFTVENGFGPDNGTVLQGNRMFGRQAFVGLSGSWGAVTVGRVYTMLLGSIIGVDVMGASQYSIGSIDSYLPNARSDNTISYKGSFNGFTGGATYSLGRDTSNAGGPPATNCGGEDATDHKACRQWSALLRYDHGNWGVAAAYDTMNGGAGAAFNLNRSSLSDSRLNIGAYAKFSALTIGGGVMRRNNQGAPAQPRSDLMYIGASYQMTPALVLDADVAQLDFKHSPNDTGLIVLRATYNLSARTAVYALLGRVQNTGTAANSLSPGATVGPGLTQTGVMTGIKHTF